MITYVNETDILATPLSWSDCIAVIERAVHCLHAQDYAQPLKPYLRYKQPQNRIIAMPAYVGGAVNQAGIKWIASFPDNYKRKLPRASSVVILNDAETGQPVSIINTALLSIIRTASVSGLLLQKIKPLLTEPALTVGIVGWGPIGQYHFQMCQDVFGSHLKRVLVYDINPEQKALAVHPLIQRVDSWQAAYAPADVFITCTVAKEPYIDRAPKPGSVHLNVSLRDYEEATIAYFKECLIVDDWDEVCRENTYVERVFRNNQLRKDETLTLVDVVCRDLLTELPHTGGLMFNPMGMAVFDIAMGQFLVQQVIDYGKGLQLAA